MSLSQSPSTSGETNEPWPSVNNPRKLEFLGKFKALVSRYSVAGLKAEEEISVRDLIYNEKESRRMLGDMINVNAKNVQENSQAGQSGAGDGKEVEWKWIHLPANAVRVYSSRHEGRLTLGTATMGRSQCFSHFLSCQMLMAL